MNYNIIMIRLLLQIDLYRYITQSLKIENTNLVQISYIDSVISDHEKIIDVFGKQFET